VMDENDFSIIVKLIGAKCSCSKIYSSSEKNISFLYFVYEIKKNSTFY